MVEETVIPIRKGPHVRLAIFSILMIALFCFALYIKIEEGAAMMYVGIVLATILLLTAIPQLLFLKPIRITNEGIFNYSPYAVPSPIYWSDIREITPYTANGKKVVAIYFKEPGEVLARVPLMRRISVSLYLALADSRRYPHVILSPDLLGLPEEKIVPLLEPYIRNSGNAGILLKEQEHKN